MTLELDQQTLVTCIMALQLAYATPPSGVPDGQWLMASIRLTEAMRAADAFTHQPLAPTTPH